MTVYRCDWCGRFYSSPLPEWSACDDHIPEHNARLTASIARHNARLRAAQAFDQAHGLRPLEEPPPRFVAVDPVDGVGQKGPTRDG